MCSADYKQTEYRYLHPQGVSTVWISLTLIFRLYWLSHLPCIRDGSLYPHRAAKYLSLCRSKKEKVACKFILTSPAVPRMCSCSYLDFFLKWVAVQLLFSEVLLLGFVQNSTQLPCVVLILLFSNHFDKVHVLHLYGSTDTVTAWITFRLFSWEISDFHTVDNLSIRVHDLPMRKFISLSVLERYK